MKKFLSIIILLTAVIAYGATKCANYAGKWTLDKAQSKSLPPLYENIKSQKLTIRQDEKLLKIAIEIAAGENTNKFSLDFKLDGTDSKGEVPIRTPNGQMNVPATLKAIDKGDGKLQLTISREVAMGGNTIKATTVEDWELSADGKTLKIHRVDNSPRGRLEFDMFFVKE